MEDGFAEQEGFFLIVKGVFACLKMQVADQDS
jgi:hypothetical protein